MKARHRAVDQVDLLLMLRDLLATNLEVRAEMQGLFDHVFVDEFQDTDPLQAEIILYLCEEKPVAKRWQDVVLAPGRLTLVGDPEAVDLPLPPRRHLRLRVGPRHRGEGEAPSRSPHRQLPVAAGAHRPPERPLRRDPGQAGGREARLRRRGRDRRQSTARRRPAGQGEEVRRGAPLPDRRTARRTRTASSRPPSSPRSSGPRRPNGRGYGDVAVLAHSTFNVPCLTAELDRLGVPWSARGGSLFLKDPLHVQFLLALRAVADRDDGIAVMALLRAPFFAVDLADLVRARAEKGDTQDEGILRARAAEEQVRELRRRRFERPPGETARDLLEKTGFGRAVAFGPNGRQRLERLRELCFEVERVAASEGLDFDAVTARMREWVDEPEGIDPPRPVGGDAVQIMTIHQAKGLEFPVVVWWDARAKMAPRDHQVAWHVSREDGAWAIDIAGLAWEEPEGRDLLAQENDYIAAERRRLVYVAGTRARDLLVLPVSAAGGDGYIANALVGVDSPAVEVFDEWAADEAPAWAKGVKEPPARKPKEAKALAASVEKEWTAATTEAGKPRFEPRGISAEAHARVEAQAEDEAGARWKDRESRFGNVFGETVHLAIGVALREPRVARGAKRWLASRRRPGSTSTSPRPPRTWPRALAALEREGLRRVPGDDLRLEYPIATGEAGKLLLGYLDLLATKDGGLVVVDFKTDAPPKVGVAESYPAYVEQVREYGRILVKLGLAKAGAVRCGLLFTGDGGMRWV